MEVKLSFYSSSLLFSPLPTSLPSAPKFMTIFFRPQRAMALPSFLPPPHTFPSSYLICVPYTHSNIVATMCTKKARKSERQKSSPERDVVPTGQPPPTPHSQSDDSPSAGRVRPIIPRLCRFLPPAHPAEHVRLRLLLPSPPLTRLEGFSDRGREKVRV